MERCLFKVNTYNTYIIIKGAFILCIRDKFYQEAPAEIWEHYHIIETTAQDVESIRPVACHKCGVHHCMVIHQYRVRFSQDVLKMVVYIILVRFKCIYCGTTITIIPCFTHCNQAYDAQTIYSYVDLILVSK